MRAAESHLKSIQNQRKIEEKKALDNYTAGGINRTGLMQEFDRINSIYDERLEQTKMQVTQQRAQLQMQDQPAAVAPVPPAVTLPVETASSAPVGSEPTSPAPVSSAPAAKTPSEKILSQLTTLDEAKTGNAYRLLVELPQQGQTLTLQRSADGNGIFVLAGTEKDYSLAQYFPDADLIRAGLTADDITSLPVGTLSGAQLTASSPTAKPAA